MKALEYLYRMRKGEEEVGNYDATNLYEAINELEALQHPKNCEGCKYEHEDAYSLPCAACVRNCDRDYYEPKKGAMR